MKTWIVTVKFEVQASSAQDAVQKTSNVRSKIPNELILEQKFEEGSS